MKTKWFHCPGCGFAFHDKVGVPLKNLTLIKAFNKHIRERH